MGYCARVQGGMLTRDLTAWDWKMIGIDDDFAWCYVPRTKTRRGKPQKPQKLRVPGVIRAALRRWWQKQGEPREGAIFPVRRGARKGEARKAQGVSFAKRLRHALLKAGIKRHACEHPEILPQPAVKGHKATADRPASPPRPAKPCCAKFATDPLYNKTYATLPVDFHSFRRAFATALAEADVSPRQAMHLTGHSDAKVHERYIMQKTEKARTIPEAVIPQRRTTEQRPVMTKAASTPQAAANESAGVEVKVPAVSARQAHGPGMVFVVGRYCDFFERDTGFEPATLSLGRCAPTANLREIEAVLKSCVYSRRTLSDRVSPVSSLNRPTASAIPLHVRALATELLGRGKDALDAVVSMDRSAVGQLKDALTVAMELAEVISGKRRSVACPMRHITQRVRKGTAAGDD
jgi:hypothetical protein